MPSHEKSANNREEPRVRRPEILAPAGSMEALQAAILVGADAIYVGGTSFGARAYADNLDKDALLTAMDYVHRQGKKLYLTVNTLVKEQEFVALYEFLAPFYAAGLDAAIVQDVGVVRFLAKYFPSLPIHASTQMTLTGASGAKIFEGYPVTRIVPARELSLAEVKELCTDSPLEVEIFVHGAYCYCYSGQCLMSSIIGGRSGNRGRCAQPCRMEYKTEDKKTGYFLSPKDLCGLSLLPELIETGAASFKIEGRMKRPEYAAAVAAAYREGVERYFCLGTKGYREYLREHPDYLERKITELADLYNRGGFTTGCFQKKNGPELMSMLRPGHFGVEVGRVTADLIGRAEFVTTKEVAAQDVFELRRKNGAEKGIPGYYEFTLGAGAKVGEKVSVRLPAKLTAKKGDLIYRMKNTALLEKIAKNYLREGQTAAEGIFYAKSGEVCTLTLLADTVTVCVEGFLCEKAGKLPATEESVKKQLCKTGNEAFFFSSLQIVLADDVFLPNGQLNELRRTAFARLAEALRKGFARTDALPWDGAQEAGAQALGTREAGNQSVAEGAQALGIRNVAGLEHREKTEETEKEIPMDAVVLTAEQAAAVCESDRIRRIYADFSQYPEEVLLKELEKLRSSRKEVFFVLPRICRRETKERLKRELLRIYPLVDGFLLRNYESVALLSEVRKERMGENVPEKTLVLDANLYVMNRNAKKFYEEYFGDTPYELTAPLELSNRELAVLGISDMTLVVYGRLPLMVSTHCVRKNTAECMPAAAENGLLLTDRVGKKMPVRCFCKDCYNVIYNSEVLNLFGEDKAIKRLMPCALRLDFTTESAGEIKRLFDEPEQERVLKEGFTRGHFKRGVE